MDHIANRPDDALRHAVEMELSVALKQDAPHIGVAADHGVVTLTGEVPTQAERRAAHDAVVGVVWGVRSLADDIVVRDARSVGMTDTEIAKAAQAALRHAEDVPNDVVLVEVSDHLLTLSGRVATYAERLAAARAVSYVRGVERIVNTVVVEQADSTHGTAD